MELITAATVQRTLASIPGPRCRAVSYVFASEDEEALFMATASDDSVISYAAAIAIAADGSVNKESAKKFAKNRGFLSGLMKKIWKHLMNNGGLIELGAIVGALALVGTSLTMACKNPQQFGRISQQFAAKASKWISGVGQMAAKAITLGKKSGGKVKGAVLDRLAGVLAKMKSLPGMLSSAAAAGRDTAGMITHDARGKLSAGLSAGKDTAGMLTRQAGQQVQHQARQVALRGGAALHNAGKAVQQGTNKASNAVFRAGMGVENKAGGIGRAIQRGSGIVQRVGQAPARALKQAGTGVIQRAIPA